MPFEFFEAMSPAQKRAMRNTQCVVVNMAFQGGRNHLHEELEVSNKPEKMRVVEVHNKTPEKLVEDVKNELKKSRAGKTPVYVFGYHHRLIPHLVQLHKEGVDVTGVIMSPHQIKLINSKLEGKKIKAAALAEMVEEKFEEAKKEGRL